MAEKGSNTSTSNSTEGGKSMNHDGELNDEAQDSERPVDKELQADLDRRNGKEVGGVSQEDLTAESSQEVKNEKSENHCSSTDHDPMLDPSSTLQAVQEALERELWSFREISNVDFINDPPLQDVGIPSEFTSGGGDFPGPSTSEPSQSRNGMQHSFDLDTEVASLKQNVTLLQNNLYEAAKLVKFKEARVTELQSILSNCSEKEEKSVGIELHERTRDIEIELEDLFRQKIEAEVKYLTISRTVEKLRTAAVEQVKLLEEQKTLASEQAQIVKNLGDAESKAATLKTQAKKLENCCEDIMSTDEMLKLQKRVWKYSACFLIQLVLLVVLGLFLLQISPDDAEVVPT
uniref:WPP domain-interacting protein 2 n=1 Tax=Nicotiana tabacum TaxID=4097 RepID=A0A1S4BBG1_TOBAC|nr:PREDICTED: WPP domain-interacting protein 2-like [Nicotiana tabacum]